MSDDWLEAENRRTALRRVAAYRDLCQHVRAKSKWSLFWGGLILLIWYSLPDREKFQPLGLIHLFLAALEFSSGIWSRFRPSAESILVGAIVLFAFGGANLLRYWVFAGRAGGGTLSLLFGGYMIWQGISAFRGYLAVRRAFAHRPTDEHIRWFDELVREIRAADPEADPDTLDLRTRPPVRAKLLGDTAVLLFPKSGEVMIAARDDVLIERDDGKNPGDAPLGYLVVEGADLGAFPLDPDNWRNYSAWKAAGRPPHSPQGGGR